MDEIPRSPLGIASFDSMIEGGFPRGSLILIAGHPGAGKTIFAATYLYNGAVKFSERGLYVSFVEDRISFETYMKKLGFNFRELEKKGLFYFINIPHIDVETNIESVIKKIMDLIARNKIKRVVIDSITAILQSLGSPTPVRSFLRNILVYGTRALDDVTTLVIADLPYGAEVIGYGVEEFVVDGVLVLKAEYSKGTCFRWMEIRKMRGTNIKATIIPYTIGRQGFSPIIYSTRGEERVEKKNYELVFMSTNLSSLFTKMPPGTLVLITGAHGSGKSVLAIEYALNAVVQGIKTLYISFNEQADTIRDKVDYVLENMFPKETRIDPNNLYIKYVNLFSQELSRTYKEIQDLVFSIDPGVIVFDGAEAFYELMPCQILKFMVNDLATYVRSRGETLVQTLLVPEREHYSDFTRVNHVVSEYYGAADIILDITHDPTKPDARIIRVKKSRGKYTKRFEKRLEL